MSTDIVVLVGSRAAVAARVVVSDASDDQIAACQQRVLLIPAERTLPLILAYLLDISSF